MSEGRRPEQRRRLNTWPAASPPWASASCKLGLMILTPSGDRGNIQTQHPHCPSQHLSVTRVGGFPTCQEPSKSPAGVSFDAEPGEGARPHGLGHRACPHCRGRSQAPGGLPMLRTHRLRTSSLTPLGVPGSSWAQAQACVFWFIVKDIPRTRARRATLRGAGEGAGSSSRPAGPAQPSRRARRPWRRCAWSHHPARPTVLPSPPEVGWGWKAQPANPALSFLGTSPHPEATWGCQPHMDLGTCSHGPKRTCERKREEVPGSGKTKVLVERGEPPAAGKAGHRSCPSERLGRGDRLPPGAEGGG